MALGVRGVLPFRNKSPLSWIRVDAAIQASKPEVVRELIERVSPGPYLELFGNKPVAGWTVLAHAAGQSNPQ